MEEVKISHQKLFVLEVSEQGRLMHQHTCGCLGRDILRLLLASRGSLTTTQGSHILSTTLALRLHPKMRYSNIIRGWRRDMEDIMSALIRARPITILPRDR